MQRGGRILGGLSVRAFAPNGLNKPCVSSLSGHTTLTAVVLQHLRRLAAHSSQTMAYTIDERGQPNSLGYRAYFRGPDGKYVSPFHDIPLYANTSKTEFNMVVEIPRWTNAKMEISKEEKLNPIKQDVKKEKLRYVRNIFPHHGYIWNYGALPQTWEDPRVEFFDTKTKGDKDPLDVCEIGQKIHKLGSVIKVKVLGTMLLVDEGETDWKIIAIDVTDPLAPSLNDIDDVEKHMPGFIKATCEWFTFYKVPDGKPLNKVAWHGEAKNKEFALKVVNDAYELWESLMEKPNEYGIACENTSVAGSSHLIESDEAKQIVESNVDSGETQPTGSEVDKWYYVIS